MKHWLRYDGNPRTGVEIYMVPPGEHVLLVDVESGYDGLYGVKVLKQERLEELEELAPTASDMWLFDIDSTAGPQKIYLQVWVEPKEEEKGLIVFNCTPEMTEEQKLAWALGEKFPEFDEVKVQFRVWPADAWSGVGMPVKGSVELPVGTYRARPYYPEKAGTSEWDYWIGEEKTEIVVKGGEATEVEVKFLPFGTSGLDFWWIKFDGNGVKLEGDTLLWYGRWTYPNPSFSGYEFPPDPTRVGGWLFTGWFTPAPGKKKIENWRELEDFLRHDTLANLKLTAEWKVVGNAATVSGTPVEFSWLDENAGTVLAANGGDYEAASVATAANGLPVWECYVAGLDPNDANAALRAEFTEEDGKWKIGPAGGEKAGRVYRVYGKKAMEDGEEWEDVTDVEDLEAEGWRFFRVGVELAE